MKKIKELQRCATSVLSAGCGSRDETKTVSFSFIGLPGVLLVCFGELAVLFRTVFTMTSRALSPANLDVTLSLAIPPKLCQFFPEPKTPACINTRVH